MVLRLPGSVVGYGLGDERGAVVRVLLLEGRWWERWQTPLSNVRAAMIAHSSTLIALVGGVTWTMYLSLVYA
jgi:hypothetical protein